MYTWNVNWVKPYESPWGIFNKFMYANEIYGINAARELTTVKYRALEPYRKNNIQTGIVSNYQLLPNTWLIGDKTIEEYGKETLQYLLNPLFSFKNSYLCENYICGTIIRKELYFCPKCLQYGNHFMFHQFTFLNKCIIHNKRLISTCPTCNYKIPYAIELRNDMRSYQCQQCKSYLFNNESFETILDVWNKKNISRNIKQLKPFHSSSLIPIVLTKNYDVNLTDNEVNSVLKDLFYNKQINSKPKYSIKSSIHWQEIDFGKIITPNLDEKRNLTEYSYMYALQKLSRHLCRVNRISSKLKNAQRFIQRCAVLPMINKKVIDSSFYKYFDVHAVTFYLWKRDLEYCRHMINHYKINAETAYDYEFKPDFDIMGYLEKIYYILPDIIGEDSKFSILVHIVYFALSEPLARSN